MMRAVVGIGANLGDPLASMREAVARIESRFPARCVVRACAHEREA
jgi:7,8-dihydro-6-hydroxymethylpterin-pyrophosphokinase